ncbi:uncharacterized protein LOC115626657 [Scaptodrosophila lebanonensis]|uniref:Uncharacterized protein LOC115626657 n=1 Tax=Drosophila lebanonensis TaxID=7225 RepID=A0A6J2TSN0_DROLE|nr:uncharacterized protein LOC115626657 [Scaptodrosophila lebanonensis]
MGDNGEHNEQNNQPPSGQLPPPPTGQFIAPGAFPGSLTPGWNDPPSVSADNANSRRPRLDLRKRVPFPLDGSSNATITTITNRGNAHEGGGPPVNVRPVAKVSPQRLDMPADVGNNSNNGNDNIPQPRLQSRAPGNSDMSKVPVAKVPPRQK